MIIQLNDWLFQGDWNSVSYGEYEQYGIRSIISVTEDDPPKALFISNKIFLWAPFSDWGDELTQRRLLTIKEFYALNKLDRVLVHCYGGSNRSSAICVMLLHIVDEMFLREAQRLVFEKNPHMGIERKLTKKIEQELGITIKNP